MPLTLSPANSEENISSKVNILPQNENLSLFSKVDHGLHANDNLIQRDQPQSQPQIDPSTVNLSKITATFCKTSMDIDATILGINVKCLVDTGANVSCVSEEFWYKLSTYQQCPKLWSTPLAFGRVANESQLQFIGRVQLELNICDQQVSYLFYVARNLNHQCLLGSDFLAHHESRIDFQTRTISFEENDTGLSDREYCQHNTNSREQ